MELLLLVLVAEEVLCGSERAVGVEEVLALVLLSHVPDVAFETTLSVAGGFALGDTPRAGVRRHASVDKRLSVTILSDREERRSGVGSGEGGGGEVLATRPPPIRLVVPKLWRLSGGAPAGVKTLTAPGGAGVWVPGGVGVWVPGGSWVGLRSPLELEWWMSSVEVLMFRQSDTASVRKTIQAARRRVLATIDSMTQRDVMMRKEGPLATEHVAMIRIRPSAQP